MQKTYKISIPLLSLTYFIVFVCWLLYRYFTRFPDLVDELLMKPLIWISPVIYISFLKKFRFKELGFKILSLRFFLLSAVIGIGLTALQFLPLYFQFHKVPSIPPDFIILALATIGTAVSEEILFRGFIFKQLQKQFSTIISTLITSILFSFMHVPILIFIQNTAGINLISSLYIIFVSSLVFCLLYWYTKNLWSPIIAHFILDTLLLIF